MGMSISGVLVVGLPFDEVCEDSADFYENYDDVFDRISPYYDADNSDCVVGWCLARGHYKHTEVSEETLDSIAGLKAEFREVTGKDAKVFVMPNVT